MAKYSGDYVTCERKHPVNIVWVEQEHGLFFLCEECNEISELADCYIEHVKVSVVCQIAEESKN